jgi:predicted amidohydrolase YtcJ
MMTGMKALEDGYPESFCPASENHHLAPGPVKIILGEVSGGIYPPPRELQEMVLAVHRAGLQVAIHAFEPAEIDAACHAIQYALEKHPASHHRHRIEHCSVCNEAMARKLASLGIVVATQPPFIYTAVTDT